MNEKIVYAVVRPAVTGVYDVQGGNPTLGPNALRSVQGCTGLRISVTTKLFRCSCTSDERQSVTSMSPIPIFVFV